jgi:hypothetical protein
MTHDLERYLYHSHQGWPVYGIQTSPSLTGEAMSRCDDWADGWNEGRREAIRECIAAVEAAARDRLHDLRTCNKDDDCYVKAEGVALMLDDAIYELRALQDRP